MSKIVEEVLGYYYYLLEAAAYLSNCELLDVFVCVWANFPFSKPSSISIYFGTKGLSTFFDAAVVKQDLENDACYAFSISVAGLVLAGPNTANALFWTWPIVRLSSMRSNSEILPSVDTMTSQLCFMESLSFKAFY